MRRLVRQRVGLLQPPGRPRRARRQVPVADDRPHVSTRQDSHAGHRVPRRPRPARAGPLRPQRPPRDPADRRPAAITDDGRIRASAAHASRRSPTRGARVVVCAHLGRPKGEPRPELLAGPGRQAAGRAARRRGRRSPPTWSGDVGPGGRRRPGRRRGRAAGEPPLRRRARPARTTPSAAPSPTSSPASADALRRRRLRRRAPQAGQRLRRRRCGCRTPRAAWSRAEVEVLRRLTVDPARPYAVVLGGSKVSDKLGGHREPAARRSTACSSAAAWSSPSWPRRGTRSAPRCSRPTRSTPCAGCWPTPRPAACRSCCPSDIVVAPAFAADAAGDRGAGRRDPRRPDGPGHRPASRRGVRRGAGRRAGRSSGTARWASSSSPPSPPAPARVAEALTEVDRAHGRRRRRLRRRGPHARLPRRRRSATSPPAAARRLEYLEGKTAARPRPLWRTDPHARRTHAHPADRRQLEDEPQPPRGHRAGPEARVLAARTTTTTRCDVAVLPPFTDLRSVQTLVDGDKLRLGYGAQDVSAHDVGRLHRRDLRGDAGQAGLLATSSSATPSGGSTTTRTTRWSPPRPKAALAHGMTPIVCVGEGLEVARGAATTSSTRSAQLDGSLAGLTAEQVATLVIAYEPVWAIGTGEVATPDDAQEVCARDPRPHRRAARRPARRSRSGCSTAARSRAPTSAGIMAKADVDGALVGGAALDAEDFTRICRFREGLAD